MNIYVLDSALERVGVIDYYKSIIWTRRYYEPGDFELCIEATPENIALCGMGRMLYRDVDCDSNTGAISSVMIIEYIQITTSAEEGDTLILQGRDLKSILHKRIVWRQTVLSGTLEDNVRAILTQNIISPAIEERAISNFVLGTAIGGTDTLQMQATGDNVGEWVTQAIAPYEIGYDVYLTNGNFVFELVRGVDRSFEQTAIPYVVFSPSYDNLMTSDYVADAKESRNVALVAGEGEGTSRKTATAGDAAASGMSRNELFVDEKSASTDADDGPVPPATYTAQLITKGLEALAEHQMQEAFEGEIDAETNFAYGIDYQLGDKVEIINDHGVQRAGRIIEVIDSEDETGRTVVPTFSTGGYEV